MYSQIQNNQWINQPRNGNLEIKNIYIYIIQKKLYYKDVGKDQP